MPKRRNVVHNVNVNNDNIINTETSNQEQKQKLLDEIANLKASISKLEYTVYTFKFGQLQLAEKPLYRKEDITCRKIPNVQTKLCYDLYHFLGLQCVQFKSRLVFEICSAVSPMKNDMYAIEILINDDARGKLGKWILPMFLDIHKILLQYPIDNLKNLGYFLKCCKRHIDCYVYRNRQFNELQNLLLGFRNARGSHNIGITQIELIISGVKDIDNNIVYNLTLDLYYKADEVRPYKLLPDVDNNEQLSITTLKRLTKYFKPFLKENLNSAFLKISEAQCEFIWEKIVVDNNKNDIESQNESNSEETGFLTALLRRKSLKNKKYDKTNSLNNEMEHSLFADIDENEHMNETNDDFSKEDEEIKSKKYKERKAIVKSRTTNKLQSKFKQSRKRAANVEERNDQNIADVNKSLSNTYNSVNCILNEKRFKKLKTLSFIEDVHMEDKHTLLENDNNYSSETIDDISIPKRKSPRKLTNKSQKKTKTPRQKLIDEYNNNSVRESSVNVEQMKKKRRTVTWNDEIGDKEKYTILHHNDNESIKMGNSTPISTNLPDRREFFNASGISEILPLEETNRE